MSQGTETKRTEELGGPRPWKREVTDIKRGWGKLWNAVLYANHEVASTGRDSKVGERELGRS